MTRVKNFTSPSLGEKSVLRSAGQLTAGRLASAVLQSGMLLVLAIDSTAVEAGTFLSWYVIALFSSGFTDFGLVNMTLSKSGTKASSEARGPYSLGALTGALVLVLSISILQFLPIGEHEKLIASGLFLWAQLDRLADLGFSFDISEGKSLRVGMLLGGRRLGAIIIYHIMTQAVTVSEAYVFGLVASSGLSLLLFGKISKRVTRIRLSEFSGLFGELRPFLANSIFGQARSLETPLIAFTLGQESTASYSLAARLLSPVSMLYGSGGTALLGSGSSLNKAAIKRIVVITVIGMSALSLPMFFSSEIAQIFSISVPWLLESSVYVVCIVGIRTMLWGYTAFFSMDLMAKQCTHTAVKINGFFVSTTLMTPALAHLLLWNVLTVAMISLMITIVHAAALTVASMKRVK